MDRFGNLISNIPAGVVTSQLGERGWRLEAGPLSLKGLARTYADAAPGEFLALAGSHGFIEIACAMDNAAHRLQAGVGLTVSIRKAPSAKVKGGSAWGNDRETTGPVRFLVVRRPGWLTRRASSGPGVPGLQVWLHQFRDAGAETEACEFLLVKTSDSMFRLFILIFLYKD